MLNLSAVSQINLTEKISFNKSFFLNKEISKGYKMSCTDISGECDSSLGLSCQGTNAKLCL